MHERPRPIPWAAVAVITAAAAALRLPFLGVQGLWHDETVFRSIVTLGSLGDVWDGVRARDAGPPLHHILTWVWGKVFGVGSDAGLRAVAGLASVACVPAAFAAFRRRVGDRGALAVAVLVAASPALAWFAHDASEPSLLLLFALLSLWAMTLVIERPTARRWAGWALAATAAVWTHELAVVLVAAEVAVLLARLPEARARALAWAGLVAVLCAPLLTFLSAGERVSGYAGPGAGQVFPRPWLEVLSYALLVASLAAGLWALRGSLRARRAAAAAVAAYALAGVVAIVWLAADWRRHNVDWDGATEGIPARAPVAVFPARDAPLANAYLDRRTSAGPVTSDTVWLVVAPRRDGRELVPVRPRAIGPPDFVRREVRDDRGFHVIELRAPDRRAFVPQAFGSPPPALLLPRG